MGERTRQGQGDRRGTPIRVIGRGAGKVDRLAGHPGGRGVTDGSGGGAGGRRGATAGGSRGAATAPRARPLALATAPSRRSGSALATRATVPRPRRPDPISTAVPSDRIRPDAVR